MQLHRHAEIAQALYNPIAYQTRLEQLERRTRQLSVFDDEEDEHRRLVLCSSVAPLLTCD